MASQKFTLQAARFSLLTPFCIMFANFVLRFSGAGEHIGSWIIGTLSIVFMLASLILGIVALVGMRQHGTKGILVRAIIGTTVSLAMIVLTTLSTVWLLHNKTPSAEDVKKASALCGTWQLEGKTDQGEYCEWLRLNPDKSYELLMDGCSVAKHSGTWLVQDNQLWLTVLNFVEGNPKLKGNKAYLRIDYLLPEKASLEGEVYSRLKGSEGKSLADLQRAYQVAQVGMSKYPAWIGALQIENGNITALSHNDQAPYSKMVRGYFAKKFSILQLQINNQPGSQEVALDLRKLVVRNTQGAVIPTIAGDEVLASVIDKKEDFGRFFRREFTAAKASAPFVFLCFPEGTDWNTLQSLTFVLNGTETTMKGRLFSVEEMAALGIK